MIQYYKYKKQLPVYTESCQASVTHTSAVVIIIIT